jgi:uroporphyrin-III C-methyltransferase
VYLIGAGPGAADLITMRGRRRLARADVVVYDELLPEDFPQQLGIGPDRAELVWLGGTGSRPKQEEVNALMLEAALAGRTVARVKAGDPFVFGRAREEIEFLAGRGVEVEVVPGVSSAIAGPAGAWLPLTHRGESRSFAVVTARCEGGVVNDSYPDADNLVVLMGIAALPEVVAALVAAGRPEDAPVAVIERAGLPWERRVRGSLGTVVGEAERAGVAAPAVVVIGPGAARRTGPADRKLVLFTGLDPANFRFLGDLLHWPALEVTGESAGRDRLPAAIEALRAGRFGHAIFTSRVGVDSFFAALTRRDLDSRVLAGCKVIAAGGGTAERLAERGVRADRVPEVGGSPGILAGIEAPRAVLLVQGTHAPRGLEEALASRGAEVLRLALHRVGPHSQLGRPLPEHDVIYFVSPSGARAYHNAYGAAAFEREVWCIGAATGEQLAALGVESKVMDPHGRS